MLAEGVVLAGASAATELLVVARVPAVREAVVKHDLVGVVFSTALSWLVGWLFGATGLTVLLAALSSTVFTWIVYKGLKFYRQSDGLIKVTAV